jgi:hypothetical protein
MAPELVLTPELQQAEGTLAPQPQTLTPAQGAATMANQLAPAAAPAATDSDQAADDALKARVTQPAPATPFGQKLAAALDQNPIPLNADGQPVKGGWSRSLVSGAVSALQGLGDVPTGKAPVGGGIMSGIAGTIKNRNERMAAQRQQQFENKRATEKDLTEKQKADLDMTHSNIQFQHEQALWHTTQEVAPMVAQGSKALSMLENSPHPAPVVARDIDSDELKAGVISGKYNAHEYTPFASGTKTNPDGTTRALYTVVQSGGPVTLDGEKDKDTIQFLNANHATDKDITPGQELTFGQFNSLYQTASNNAAATAARNKTLVDNKLATADQAKKMEAVDFAGDGVWLNALNNAPKINGIPDQARAIAAIQGNVELAKKYPYLMSDVIESVGGQKAFDTILENNQKNVNSNYLKTFTDDLNALPYLDSTSKQAFVDDAKRIGAGGTKDQLDKVSARAERQNSEFLQKKMSENNTEALKQTTHDDAISKQVSDGLDDLAWKSKGNYKVSAELNNEFSETLNAVKNGDQVAAAFARTQGIQDVNNVAQLSRIPPTEYASQDEAGSIKRQIANKIAKAGSGTMSPATLAELKGLQTRLQATQYAGYVGSVVNMAGNRGMKDTSGLLVLSPDGTNNVPLGDAVKTVASLQPKTPAQQNSARPSGVSSQAVLMAVPGGQPHWIEPQNMKAAQAANAKAVTQ